MRTLVLVAACSLALALSCSAREEDGAPPPASTIPAPASPRLRVPDLGPVPPAPDWPDDPRTPEKIALGRLLFFDARLSGSGKTSCTSCHIYNTYFADGLSLPVPDRSYPENAPGLRRNTPTLLNVVFAPALRWDGSSRDLVDVMAFPLAEPNMNIAKLPRGDERNDVDAAKRALAARLASELAAYGPQYERAFGSPNVGLAPEELWRRTGRAIRAFLAQATTGESAFDRWNAGDDGAMSESAQRGLALFRGKGRCTSCHAGPLLTDYAPHNVSTSPPREDGARSDEGAFAVTHDARDHGAFLTPSLRAVYDTGPYFHDGSRKSLRAVLQHFANNEVLADPSRDPVFSTPLELDDAEVEDLVAFLRALRSDYPQLEPPGTFP